MLPDDSLFSWKVNLKQLGCGQQQIQESSHPPDYVFQIISYTHTIMNYLIFIDILSSVTIEIPTDK